MSGLDKRTMWSRLDGLKGWAEDELVRQLEQDERQLNDRTRHLRSVTKRNYALACLLGTTIVTLLGASGRRVI